MKKFVYLILISFIGLNAYCFSLTGDTDIERYLKAPSKNNLTEKEMFDYLDSSLNNLYKKYNNLCDQILKNFEEDMVFVSAFKNNISLFEKYKESQDNVIFPRYKSNPTVYGNMYLYYKWENDYSLMVYQIERTYKTVQKYCDMNKHFLKNEKTCSQKRIDALFEGIQIK